jgi:hypothetical protein
MEICWSILIARGLRSLDVGKGVSRSDFEKKYKRLYPPCITSDTAYVRHVEFEQTQVYSTGSFDFGELLHYLCKEGYCRTTSGEESFPTLYFITEKGKEKISKKK